MRRFATIAAVCCLLGVAGCTEDQLRQGDNIARDVNDVGRAIGQVADGPAGDMLPPGVRQAMVMLGIAGPAAYGIWQKIRADLAEKDERGVIASVDTLLTSDLVVNRRKAVHLLKCDQGPKLVARLRKIKEG